MQLGMIGLGRMGANILRRVMRDGHTAVAYDTSADSVAALEKDGAVGARTLEEFVAEAGQAAGGLGDDPGRHHRAGRRAAGRR